MRLWQSNGALAAGCKQADAAIGTAPVDALRRARTSAGGCANEWPPRGRSGSVSITFSGFRSAGSRCGWPHYIMHLATKAPPQDALCGRTVLACTLVRLPHTHCMHTRVHAFGAGKRTGVDDVAGAVQVVKRRQRLAREVLDHCQRDAAEVVLPAGKRAMEQHSTAGQASVRLITAVLLRCGARGPAGSHSCNQHEQLCVPTLHAAHCPTNTQAVQAESDCDAVPALT